MSRTSALLPGGLRLSDYLSVGVIARVLPREVLRCLMEGLRWVSPGLFVRVSGKSSISRARSRLGSTPIWALREACVKPYAVASTAGAW